MKLISVVLVVGNSLSTTYSHCTKFWSKLTIDFVDHSKRNRIFVTVSNLGIPKNLIRLCRMMLNYTSSSVKKGRDISDAFEIVQSFTQNPACQSSKQVSTICFLTLYGAFSRMRWKRNSTTLISLHLQLKVTPSYVKSIVISIKFKDYIYKKIWFVIYLKKKKIVKKFP